MRPLSADRETAFHASAAVPCGATLGHPRSAGAASNQQLADLLPIPVEQGLPNEQPFGAGKGKERAEGNGVLRGHPPVFMARRLIALDLLRYKP